MASGQDRILMRQAIIASLFSPNSRGSAGQTGQTYISHCKTWEEVAGGSEPKPRYILLASGPTGHVFLHKSKRNSNGTFSIGKTWDIIELKFVEMFEKSTFKLALGARNYVWFAESPTERSIFVGDLIRSFKKYSGGSLPALRGVPPEDYGGSSSNLTFPSPALPQSSQSGSTLRNNDGTPPRPQNTRGPPVPVPPSHVSLQSSKYSTPSRQSPNVLPTPSPSKSTSGPQSGGWAPSSDSQNDPMGRRVPSNNQRQVATNEPALGSSFSQRSRTSNEEENTNTSFQSGDLPRKPPRPKISLAGIGSHNRSPNVRDAVSAQETKPPQNRIISSPLRTSNDQFDRGLGGGGEEGGETTPIKGFFDDDKTLQVKLRQSPPMAVKKRPPRKPRPGNNSPDPNSDNNEPNLGGDPPKGVEKPKDNLKNENVFDVPDVLSNVEETLEGFEWKSVLISSVNKVKIGSGGVIGKTSTVNQIEEQLLTELKALELSEIHAIIENDDRVGVIMSYLDESLAELDKMDALLSLYKTQLNIVADDVTHIESQNRGFQVQISNHRALLQEIEDIMQTIRIPDSDLVSLVQEPLDSQKGITNLERSITSLYKAILSIRDLDNVASVAAASDDKVEEYKRDAKQFCKRVYEFLIVMFKYQADLIINGKTKNSLKGVGGDEIKLPSHQEMEKYLERYCGLTLFIKEIDPSRYQQLCAAYFATSSELHKYEVGELLSVCKSKIRKPTEEELEALFATSTVFSPANTKTTMARKPLGMFDKRDKKDGQNSTNSFFNTGGQALKSFLNQLIPHLQREQNFVIDFLHIVSSGNPPPNIDGDNGGIGINSNDNGINKNEDGEMIISFADYSGLEGYFRRAALNILKNNNMNNKFKDILSVMDLIFGFLAGEVKDWIDSMILKDSLQVLSILGALEVSISKVRSIGSNEFIMKVLETQQKKSLVSFEKNVKDQLKAIETTKLTVKKRKGVVSFILIFPEFVSRVERQLEDLGLESMGQDPLNQSSNGEINGNSMRELVHKLYEQIVGAMFDALQTMARTSENSNANTPNEKALLSATNLGGQEDRDKDRLNYHTLIIENMHHFVTTVSKIGSSSLKPFLDQAKEQYDQNLNLYIRLILRRPFSRFIDFFQGIEQLLRTTSPNEITQQSQFNKSSLKRILSSIEKKDLKKNIESLSKRIEKHFNELANVSAENKVLIENVWKRCEEEVIKSLEEWNGLIEKVYGSNSSAGGGESGGNSFGSIEFGKDDVHHAFQKYKP